MPSDFLLRVHRRQPQAKRVLLIERGNWSSGHPVVSVMALGRGVLAGNKRIKPNAALIDLGRWQFTR